MTMQIASLRSRKVQLLRNRPAEDVPVRYRKRFDMLLVDLTNGVGGAQTEQTTKPS